MILVDSNLLVYLSKGELSGGDLSKRRVAYSSVTKIETLGQPELPVRESDILEQLFGLYEHLPITQDVVEKAIQLKQRRKLKLGDALIAATAMVHNLELWTNDHDFKKIPELKLCYPLKS